MVHGLASSIALWMHWGCWESTKKGARVTRADTQARATLDFWMTISFTTNSYRASVIDTVIDHRWACKEQRVIFVVDSYFFLSFLSPFYSIECACTAFLTEHGFQIESFKQLFERKSNNGRASSKFSFSNCKCILELGSLVTKVSRWLVGR